MHKIICGDALTVLRQMRDNCAHCVVTSPPYWGLRNYGVEPNIWGGVTGCAHEFETKRWYTENSAAASTGCGEAFSKAGEQNAKRLKDARWREDATCKKCNAWRGALGLEPTPQMFVQNMTEIFREVRRVLRPDGTLWLNLGDSYCSIGHKKSSSGYGTTGLAGGKAQEHTPLRRENNVPGLKHKDLIGIPWRVAFALQADGWYLRQDIIWHKPNPMPESVRDRCTKAHEYLFLLTKSDKYFFDASAIAEQSESFNPKWSEREKIGGNIEGNMSERGVTCTTEGLNLKPQWEKTKETRNKRSVWTIAPKPYKEAHFATFPPGLVEPCIRAGSPIDGIVLDPFAGAGTTGLVAKSLNRHCVLIELNPDYVKMVEKRLA